MRKNSKGFTESIKWIAFGLAGLLYKIYPMSDKSMTAYSVFIVILIILLNTSLYKHRSENLGTKYNFAFGIAVNQFAVYFLFTIGLYKFSPSIFQKYNSVMGIIALASMFILLGVIIYGSEKLSRRDNK